MKNIVILAVVLTLTSCNHEGMRWKCDCEQTKLIQGFVERNIKPANNMSDEEMEDVIRQLTKVGVSMNCQQEVITVDRHGNLIESPDSCVTYFRMGY